MSQIVAANDQNFDTEVLKVAGPVLVDFSATWCGPCKKLEPIVDEIATAFAGKVKVVKVDVDHAPGAAARFAVLSVPTLVFFKDGQVRDQHIGVASRQQISDRLQKVI